MSNKVALITGGSSGIGEATTLKPQELGYTTYAAARRVERMEHLTTSGIRPLAMDVTDEESMRSGVEQILAAEGRIDVLVNAAGYGLARATRALVTVGEDFIVLLRERRPPEPAFTAPLEALLERGRQGGQIRTDVPLATLVESFLVVVGACVRTCKTAGMGLEDLSSTALQLFLTGARPAANR